jgi:hypothetical protein
MHLKWLTIESRYVMENFFLFYSTRFEHVHYEINRMDIFVLF